MICPNCGADAYRSHSRNFRESLVKSVSPLRPFRCHECGWRGFAAPTLIKPQRINRKVIFVWIAGVLLAVAIGTFGSWINTDRRPAKPQKVGGR